MSYPRYPIYKDSGVEWLGMVPSHWEIKRLKFLGTINPSRSELRGVENDLEVSFLPMEHIGEDGTLNLSVSRRLDELESGYTYCRDGDVVVAKITPCFENGKGALCRRLANGIGLGTTELHVIRPANALLGEFLLRWTQSSPFREQGTAVMYGAGGQKRVPTEFIQDFPLPFPDVAEQYAIVAFLDHETARIDALIAKQEQMIALLQEKRKTLISHTVTRGLDPAVPLKDSGVEWLGMVPAHWEVKRLKFLADVRSGVAKGRDLGDQQTVDVPYLRVANVQDGYLDLAEVATISILDSELDRYALQPGDVLMNEGGDFDKLGRGYVWEGEIEPCIHQNHVFSVRPARRQHAYWINLVTQSAYAKHYFILKSKQSTNLASISSTNIQEMPVVMPPDAEIAAILAHVQVGCAVLEELMAKAHHAIILLKEHRASLISASVTGKIDVRWFAPGAAHGQA